MIDDESHRSVGANLAQALDQLVVLVRRVFPAAPFVTFAPEVNLTSSGELILQAEVRQFPFVPTAQAVRDIQRKACAIRSRIAEPENAGGFTNEDAKAAVLNRGDYLAEFIDDERAARMAGVSPFGVIDRLGHSVDGRRGDDGALAFEFAVVPADFDAAAYIYMIGGFPTRRPAIAAGPLSSYRGTEFEIAHEFRGSNAGPRPMGLRLPFGPCLRPFCSFRCFACILVA